MEKNPDPVVGQVWNIDASDAYRKGGINKKIISIINGIITWSKVYNYGIIDHVSWDRVDTIKYSKHYKYIYGPLNNLSRFQMILEKI